MGIKDFLFGKKATVQGHDKSGKPFEVEVPESKLREWEAAGKTHRAEAIEVHVLDPMKGYYTRYWEIGEDMLTRDPETEAVHALVVYEAGEPNLYVCPKDKWLA